MKKPQIDLSQEGLQEFFLHHIEKVILGGAIAALAFLIWNGWSTEKYSKTEPLKLSQLASRAKSHIEKDSWTDIAEFRQGDDEADDRIKEARKFKTDADQYAVRRLIGTPRATKGLRQDPELIVASNLVAKPFTSNLLIDMKYNPGYVSTLSGLSAATSPDGETEEKDERQGSAGGGVGEGGEEEEDKKKKDVPEDPFGDKLTATQKLEMLGLRPQATQSGGSKGSPFVVDGIAVTGTVNFGEQFKKYEEALRNAIGYYPLRDRPRYEYLQVQRRVFDPNPADQEAYDNSWVDISEQFYDDLYAVEMAPEVVNPVHYDATLTRNVPPLINYDYRKLALHPKTGPRQTVPDAINERNEIKTNDSSKATVGMFGGSRTTIDEPSDDGSEKEEEETVEVNFMKGDNRALYEKINPLSRPKNDLKLVRFFDFGVAAGNQYQYRVRLWLNDPNDPKGDKNAAQVKKENKKQQRGQAMNPSEGNDSNEKTEQDKDDELLKAKYVPFSTSQQEQQVRNRIRKKAYELPKFNFRALPNETEENKSLIEEEKERRKEYVEEMTERLKVAWPTDWSEPTAPVKAGSTPAEYYAGSVVPSMVQRYDEFDLPRFEPRVNLVTSFWSNRTHAPRGEDVYNTAIPTIKEVYRGDVLNYDVKKAHVLDPSSGAVKRVKDTRIKTDAVVVDMMGGGTVGRFELPVEIVSEVLVMDSEGNLRLQNSFEDRVGYRHSLFLPDENNEYGKARKKKKTERNDGGSFN